MMPDRIPGIIEDIKELSDETKKRHEDNEKRFDKIENKMSEISTEVKILVLLVLANGLINLSHLIFGGHG